MRFRDFAKSLQKAPKFCEKINKTADATLLVPTNEAFRFLSASEMDGKISADAERILGLHFIEHPPAILADDVRVTNPQDDSGVRITVKYYIRLKSKIEEKNHQIV